MARTRRVHAIEAIGNGNWPFIEAEVRGDRIAILGAGTVTSGDINPHVDALLIVGSEKAACRIMKLPDASSEQTRRMVASRFETELPYPIADSLWTCERLPASDMNPAGNVLALAVPQLNGGVVGEKLRTFKHCSIFLDAAGLAQWACVTSAENVAVVSLSAEVATLVLTVNGKLRYLRNLRHGSDWESLANELDQSLHHFSLIEGRETERMLLVGELAQSPELARVFSARLGIPVEVPALPPSVEITTDSGRDALKRMPAAAGVLMSWQRRLKGQPLSAPALRRPIPTMAERLKLRWVALIALNVALAVAAIWLAFYARGKWIDSAMELTREGRPLLQDMDRISAEVNTLEFESHQPSMLEAINGLAEILPSGLKFESITIDSKGRVAITGTTESIAVASDAAIKALRGSSMFKNPVFEGATKGQNGFKFRITCERINKAGGAAIDAEKP